MTPDQANQMLALQASLAQYSQDALTAAQLTAGHVQTLRDVSTFLCVSTVIGLTTIFGLLARKTPS